MLPRGYALRLGLRPQRAVMNALGRLARDRTVPVHRVDENVTVRLHRPAALPESAPALLWIHGGGTVMGTAAQDDRYCRKLAHLSGVAVAAVEHRLAPEHPYPAPVNDCHTAFQWLAEQPWADSSRLAVGGASAGGHFAAAVAQIAYDRGPAQPIYQLLVYPMLDDRTGRSGDGRRRIMWSESDNQRAWDWYLNGADPIGAVPARRADLSGLPAAWIGVGTLDLFYEECREYAARLRAAGIKVHEEIAEGAFHAFDQFAPNAPVSAAFFASLCNGLRCALNA